ncbi:YopX family protein [Planococcus sp. A6]|uniref:YopX family protein n=1 Tax=Planococcus sp. A6 TaxID=2992760 RepID=UPI00237B4609|nr:YopX family protein [Planococcus sp. A6]MDE0581527.1 YopX family protein [Planococcus sp. A6]
MRKIKFRVYDKDLKRMHICGDNRHDSMTFYSNQEAQYYNLQNGEGSGEHGSYELMQYTGIKVKHDVELYEGDIVPVQGMIHLGWKQGAYRFKGNGKVVYLADTMRFAFIVNTEEHGYQIVCYDKGVRQQYEVIGNIYENPDLLNT